MKKVSIFLAVLMVSMLALGAVAMAEVKLGQVQYAAHGERSFAVTTVAMDGDTIAAVLIDEFQMGAPDTYTIVPNGAAFENADGNQPFSKRINDELYSANMAERGEATQGLAEGYDTLAAFCVGKTVAELEAAVEGKDAETFLADAVTTSTLADSYNYILSVIEAAKAAQ